MGLAIFRPVGPADKPGLARMEGEEFIAKGIDF
jgi:hypothetical protein